MPDQFKNLKRPKHPMPAFVKKALEENKLMDKYHARPAYQQNDYIGWINRAVQPETKTRRLNQMITELKGGKLYMKMKYKEKIKSPFD